MSSSSARPFLLVAAAVIVVSMAAVPGSARAGRFDRPLVHYVAPVDGPVVDPFRPPAHIGAAGNRGLEYGNALFAPVTAAADGYVGWAAEVVGSGTVVIEHGDGVRTTYNGLTEIWVDEGMSVRQLDGIGLAGTNLHFGALVGSVYLDPQILIDASEGTTRARLVPVEDP